MYGQYERERRQKLIAGFVAFLLILAGLWLLVAKCG